VCRIESVEPVLESFAAAAFLAVVKPDEEQREHGEALSREHELCAADDNRYTETFHGEDINVYHACKLENPAEFNVMAEIEQYNCQHTVTAVIGEADDRQKQQAKEFQDAENKGLYYCGFWHFACFRECAQLFKFVDAQKADKQGKHDVLVERIYRRYGEHQVKRDLRNQAEYEQALGVSADIRCMEEPFHNLKGEYRKSQTAQICHPVVAGNHSCPHVVKQHENAGDEPECVGIDAAKRLSEVKCCVVFHNNPPGV